jgi:hypothetical protein
MPGKTNSWQDLFFAFYDLNGKMHTFERVRDMKFHENYPGLGVRLQTNPYKVFAGSACGFPEGETGFYFRLESGRMPFTSKEGLVRLVQDLLIDYEIAAIQEAQERKWTYVPYIKAKYLVAGSLV